jgi:chemotaxis protein CheX
MIPQTCSANIHEVAQCVFETMLNMQLEMADDTPSASTNDLLATIQITGAFMGCVILGLSDEAAKASAATMLNVPAGEVSRADERDVAAELVNMIGGNIKSLLPGPSLLSLPAVMEGQQACFVVHKAELLENVVLLTPAGPLSLRLYASMANNR